MAYTDAHTNLGIAYRERPPGGAQTDSQEVRQFLEKLTQANLALRLLRVLCHEHVKHTIDAAMKEVDEAVRAPITRTFYKDPSAWLISSIECVEEAARRDVRIILRAERNRSVAQDVEVGRRLWELSARLTDIAAPAPIR